MPTDPEIPSVIGRLLSELSWAGTTIREYRNGGRGFENVLTAEALQALDLLPRSLFLGEVIARAHGAATARQVFIREVESVTFTLLPGNFYLRPSANSHQTRIAVQPDAILQSASTHVVVEAKRLRRGSFQPKQLAREYVLALQQSQGKTPMLLLLLPEPPPVPVRGHGRRSVEAAISLHLQEVLDTLDGANNTITSALSRVEDRVEDVVCWTTWQDLLAALTSQLERVDPQEPSIRASMSRLVGTVQAAIEWHRE